MHVMGKEYYLMKLSLFLDTYTCRSVKLVTRETVPSAQGKHTSGKTNTP